MKVCVVHRGPRESCPPAGSKLCLAPLVEATVETPNGLCKYCERECDGDCAFHDRAYPDHAPRKTAAELRAEGKAMAMRPPRVRLPVERKPADHHGVPMCSHLVCPSFKAGVCAEWHHEPPEKFADICLPEVVATTLALDAHKDASEPAFDEIVALCGYAKTWEYPGQVIRDVADVVKERNELRAKLAAIKDCGLEFAEAITKFGDALKKLEK